MGRAHWLAYCVKKSPCQHRALGPALRIRVARNPVGGKMPLHFIEQPRIDDGLVLALVDQVLVHDLSEVDPVAQQVEQRAAAERGPAQFAATGCYVTL